MEPGGPEGSLRGSATNRRLQADTYTGCLSVSSCGCEKHSDQSNLRKEGFGCLFFLILMAGKSSRGGREPEAEGHIAPTTRKQESNERMLCLCSFLHVHSSGLSQGMVMPTVGGSSHFK